MADGDNVFLRAQRRVFSGLTEDAECQWSGPFCLVQAADPQLGLMKAWREGDPDGGGDEWKEEIDLTRRAVNVLNHITPRPRLLVICGDLVHAMPDCGFRADQERDLKAALTETHRSIPLVFVSGNHDLGNKPTPSTLEQYRRSWGDDYFSFWVGGVFCLVLNSQLFFDSSLCPEQKEEQEVWLEEQLNRASSSTEPKPKHVLVFQHIPLFLQNPNEDDDYFNLQRDVRLQLLERFKRAGVKAVFSGHYHRNAGAVHEGLDMVVSSAIGCQLGADPHGLRVVVVTEDEVKHRYYSLEELELNGLDPELRKLLQGN